MLFTTKIIIYTAKFLVLPVSVAADGQIPYVDPVFWKNTPRNFRGKVGQVSITTGGCRRK